MQNKAWLVERYGEGPANAIMEEKRALQRNRKPDDPMFVMRNPDLPDSEESC